MLADESLSVMAMKRPGDDTPTELQPAPKKSTSLGASLDTVESQRPPFEPNQPSEVQAAGDEFDEAVEAIISGYKKAKGRIRTLRELRKDEQELVLKVVEEAEQLKKKNGQLCEKNEDSREESEDLWVENEDLREENTKSKKDIEVLTQELDDVKRENETLNSNICWLQREATSFEESKIRQKTALERAQKESHGLSLENGRLSLELFKAYENAKLAEKKIKAADEQSQNDRKILEAAKKLAALLP